MITKKDFNAIAKIINKNLNIEGYSDDAKEETATYLIMKDLSDYFETENPNFQKEKFIEACLK